MSGRGFGKTQAGEDWFYKRGMAGDSSRRMMLAGRTPSDVRDYSLYGPGGLLTHHPDLDYQPSNRLIVWPTGALAHIRSGANPEEFRNFSGDTVWIEEFAAWKYPRESWDNLMFGTREADPRICMTTTPKPIPVLKELIEAESTIVIRGSSYENRDNLSERYVQNVLDRYKDTRLGQQEIYGMLLEDVPGALWRRSDIEEHRVRNAPDLARVVVGIDPAATSGDTANETGIIIEGKLGDEGYVIGDHTIVGTPEQWATAAINAYLDYEADLIIVEDNNGGEMVESTIRTVAKTMGVSVSVKRIHASRGKHTRAQPIAALYEQGKIHHVGSYPELEDQQCTWIPGDDSPDRMDACVWGFTELLLVGQPVAAWA